MKDLKEHLELELEPQQPQLVLEMSQFGNFYKNKLTIFVFSNEGYIPHFHIISRDKKLRTCIEILKSRYFHHKDYQGYLDVQQRKDLNKFLKAKGKGGEQNWVQIVGAWNSGLSNRKIPIGTLQPDYTTIEDDK